MNPVKNRVFLMRNPKVTLKILLVGYHLVQGFLVMKLIVSESKVRELLTSRAKCGFKINQNLIRDGKNTGSG